MPKYKYCFVPYCTSTTVTCPEKLFLIVPSNPSDRIKWFKAARRDLRSNVSPKSDLYCCQDHFKLEEDLLNYRRYKFYHEFGMRTRLALKPETIPHLFACQEVLNVTGVHPHIRKKICRKKIFEELVDSSMEFVEAGEAVSEEVIKDKIDVPELPGPSRFIEVPLKMERSVQVSLPAHFRSRGIQTTPTKVRHSPSAVKPSRSECSTQVTPKKRTQQSSSDTSILSLGHSDLGPEYAKKRSMEEAMFLIRTNPKFHINLMPELMGLIDSMSDACECPARDIMLTIKKLKLNTSFVSLGDCFGLPASQASRIFRATLPKLASVMREMIHWPDKESDCRNMPILFSRKCKLVDSIIDCFEIEIEKPTNPQLQAMTWSEYHQANTFKYMISCSPNGFINFLSSGYGGRCTDTKLAIDSNFLKELKPGMEVMADRGFESLADVLHAKQVKLIRAPIVRRGEKLSKPLAMEAKRIASLRIHFKKVMRRLRRFNFISHVCIDDELIPLLDCAVKVCAGLVNLQNPLFFKN